MYLMVYIRFVQHVLMEFSMGDIGQEISKYSFLIN